MADYCCVSWRLRMTYQVLTILAFEAPVKLLFTVYDKSRQINTSKWAHLKPEQFSDYNMYNFYFT